jgi:hypothetical protein
MNCGDIVTWKHTFYCANSEGEAETDNSTRRRSEHQEKVWMEEDHLSHAKNFGLGPDLEKL